MSINELVCRYSHAALIERGEDAAFIESCVSKATHTHTH